MKRDAHQPGYGAAGDPRISDASPSRCPVAIGARRRAASRGERAVSEATAS
ncbi:MAG TPA: hypothetical protein VI365_27215 [Trebonia sp.]